MQSLMVFGNSISLFYPFVRAETVKTTLQIDTNFIPHYVEMPDESTIQRQQRAPIEVIDHRLSTVFRSTKTCFQKLFNLLQHYKAADDNIISNNSVCGLPGELDLRVSGDNQHYFTLCSTQLRSDSQTIKL